MKHALALVVAAITALLVHVSTAQAAQKDVEVRAYVNDVCIVADEPYLLPPGTDQQTTTRSIALASIVVGKLAEALIKYAVKSAAGRITTGAARKDTRYAVAKETNLFRVQLQPSPSLALNARLGCLTIVAGKFQPDGVECITAYVPRTLAPETLKLPESQWRTSRTDDSLENPLRRANVCLDGRPRAIYESRFEFSDDRTAYRLRSAGYQIDSLLTTKDKRAARNVFYTLDIAQPGRTGQPEVLSTALVNLGKVSVGGRADAPAENPAPWLHVPALSVDARRAYEEQTRVHQNVWAETEALQRSIVRNQRIVADLQQRIGASKGKLAEGLKQQKLKSEVQVQTLQAELAARKAEYADLPREPLEFMPVSIEIGVTETKSEKRALLAMAQIMERSSDMIASLGALAAPSIVGRLTRSVDAAPAAGDAELEDARAGYFDALVESRVAADTDAPAAKNALALARARYNTARNAVGMEAIP